ncbi:MAG TPA: sulfatase-like hydrolase/transferase [Candidatus Hydrogenedentes bacterium]|nr:sulfatase-like hydrolase/transferase [Candidatus Hydrogenedentota bacterium]HOL77209.1 sulfatase-like hydrolase/transferase [Candidatus Hydrogenedentota bacterium]HPO85852.1 sulfatase-like hydrolase/transferase [Candidatus Hydrogenedentota bacterium]
MALVDPEHLPNILIIMADDLGPWALHCAETPELITPNIDRIAAEGTRFENCFCASPVCSPARATFLTRRIPSCHGVHDWLRGGNIATDQPQGWSGKDRPIEYLSGLTGFTDVLAVNGYLCGLSGKWHLGASHLPQKSHGYWCAYALGGGSYVNYHFFDNAPELKHSTQYVTDLFTDRALQFLQTHGNKKQPFCLSVHYTAPHSPWIESEQPPEIWSLYNESVFSSLPVVPPHPWQGWNPSQEERRRTIQGYFTTITAMDRAIGRILGTLDELNIADKTLVIFTSDNGFNVGHHGILGKGNGTYPLNMYEESVKVPFVARYPQKIPAGVVRKELISHYDFFPTLLDFLGLENPIQDQLPGKSFAPLLRGESGGHETVVVHDEYGPVRMIRDAHWKYIHRFPCGPHELYNLEEDPRETVNRIQDLSCREVVEQLREKLEQWFRMYALPERDGASLPVTGKGQIDAIGGNKNVRECFMPYK